MDTPRGIIQWDGWEPMTAAEIEELFQAIA